MMHPIYTDPKVNIYLLETPKDKWLEIRDSEDHLVELMGAKGFSKTNLFERLAEFFYTKINRNWIAVKQLGTKETDLLLNINALSQKLGIKPSEVKKSNKTGNLIKLIEATIVDPVTAQKKLLVASLEVVNPQLATLLSKMFERFKGKIDAIQGLFYNTVTKEFSSLNTETDPMQKKNVVYLPGAETTKNEKTGKIFISLGEKIVSSHHLSREEEHEILNEARKQIGKSGE